MSAPLQGERRLSRRSFTADEYCEALRAGDRVMLSRAITLAESSRDDHRLLAEEIIERLLPHTGNSLRVGITGVPGVGKSTFIESFGKFVLEQGRRLAVLAVDPSSSRTHGSILGDKTRMVELSRDERAFIRPSPSAGSLGGVARKTRESILLCEAAGFDTIFVETVGVGQSEIAVRRMVDFFLLLMLAGAGDELQGIKRGIMEMADLIAINKADGDNEKAAKRARGEYRSALHLFPLAADGWSPKVLTCSAQERTGLDDIWATIEKHHEHMSAGGHFTERRREQAQYWMYESIDETIRRKFYESDVIKQALPGMEREVLEGKQNSFTAARRLIEMYEER